MNRRQIRKGSIEEAFDKADLIVKGVYRPAAIEHVPMETQVAQVVPEPMRSMEMPSGSIMTSRMSMRIARPVSDENT